MTKKLNPLEYEDPKPYWSGVPAWVVDKYGNMIKVQYDCPIEPFNIHGKTVWLKGNGEIGDPVKIYFHLSKDRFGQVCRVPLTEEEHLKWSEKEWEKLERINRPWLFNDNAKGD